MSSLSRKKFGEGYLFTFLVCIVTAAVLYTPFLIIDKGLFQYCGDFNSQQIPFYTYMNGFVKTAGGQWSWNTDLGTSAINGYSFYLLGSPFFWLSTLLPQSAVPYAMVPLLVLKFGVCGLAAYTYLYRYAKTRQAAVIASVLYAFSGFTVYNTFFNHFLDCIALFPLLLWALDEAVLENRKALLPVLLAVNLVNNYFFFAGQAVFLIIYFVWKAVRGEYRLRTGLFFRLAFETVLGCAMGCVLLVPAVSFLLGNPRTVDPSSGFGFLIYSKPQQYFAILTSLFLPPDPTYLPNIFTDCIIKHTSMTAYLPVVGAAGVFAYMGARKRSANTAILWTCLVMALVPVLNSSFYALNSSYYARWYYMPILIMCAATMHALEDADIDLMRGIRPVAVITAVYLVFISGAQGRGRRVEPWRGAAARAVLAYLAYGGAWRAAVFRHCQIFPFHHKILCRAAGRHFAVQRVLFRVPYRHGQVPPVGERRRLPQADVRGCAQHCMAGGRFLPGGFLRVPGQPQPDDGKAVPAVF